MDKDTKIDSFGFCNRDYFFIDHELAAPCPFPFFQQAGKFVFGCVFSSFVLGARFDIQFISIVLVLLLLAGCFPFPALDPFRHKAGKKTALFLVGLAAFLVVFFYAVDFAHYSYLSQRLNASVLNYLADTGISANMVWQTYPVLRIILLLIAGTWLIR